MCSDLADMISLTSIFRYRFQTKAFLQPGLWSCSSLRLQTLRSGLVIFSQCCDYVTDYFSSVRKTCYLAMSNLC